jgi:hypothetical protein
MSQIRGVERRGYKIERSDMEDGAIKLGIDLLPYDNHTNVCRSPR